jgi:thiol-disulfide isomerase/thioredoxin
MKNKNLKILAILIPVLLIGVMVYFFISFQKKKAKVEVLQNIPAFSLKTIDGKTFSTENLAKNRNKVLVYFSPECHFCQAEAEELSKIYTKYPKIQWVFVASEPLEEIKKFAANYHLDKVENIHWCKDDKAKLYQSFEMNSVPYFLAYDKDNKLVFRNKGAIKLEKILEKFDEGR